MEPATVLVVALVVAGVAGVLLLPRRKQWNADGEADAERMRREADRGPDGEPPWDPDWGEDE